LMQTYTTLSDTQRYECNFTIYHRPPAFIKRESGKLLLLIAASFVFAFSYPITYWVLTYAQTLQENLLQQEYKEVHNTKITRESTIKNKLADKAKSTALLKEEKTEYTRKKNTLIKIHDVKVNYPMKAKLLAMFTKDLNKFGVKLNSINYNEKNATKTFELNLVSSRDRKITKLIQYLTKAHEDKFKFALIEISYDDKSKVYLSQLKVNIL